MSFKYPLFNLNFDFQETDAVIETINSGWISTGPKTIALENKFAKLLNADFAIATSNCTVALHLALKLIGITEGDEVICPSLTFVATCNAIRYVNAIPVFADIESLDSPCISLNDIEKKITSKTKAILVMHYAGFPCDMDAIMNIARNNNLKVIEDACHAPLSEYKGKKLGTIGDVGCFSFFSNKNISTGEGGMLITNNSTFHQKAKLLRSHGMTSMSYQRAIGHVSSYDVVEFGYNYRMDDIRASIGIVQLDKLEIDLQKRKQIRKYYIDYLGQTDTIIIPFKDNMEYCSNYIFPILVKNIDLNTRDIIRELLAAQGIQTSIHYPPVHRFSIYKDYFTELPLTDRYYETSLTLPMYGNLDESDIKFISKIVIDICAMYSV
jgi:dTDP-4-amino-4,6-dideoxygalactose transaminase